MIKVLIIYDSVFGNTEQIAQALGRPFGDQADAAILRVSDVKPDQFAGLKILIIGSPTQRFRPTAAISDLLKGIPEKRLKNVRVTAFDTRLTTNEIKKTPILAFFVRMSGNSAYAATHIANGLRKKGGELVVPPEGFFVEGMEGPLVQGELERAANWARQIKTQVR